MTTVSIVSLDDYQDSAIRFAIYRSPLYPFLALAEEAGEVAGKMAKRLRKYGHEGDPVGGLSDEDRVALVKELGDVLWQLAACCNELGYDLSEVAEANIEKLESRQARGVIDGSGDAR